MYVCMYYQLGHEKMIAVPVYTNGNLDLLILEILLNLVVLEQFAMCMKWIFNIS